MIKRIYLFILLFMILFSAWMTDCKASRTVLRRIEYEEDQSRSFWKKSSTSLVGNFWGPMKLSANLAKMPFRPDLSRCPEYDGERKSARAWDLPRVGCEQTNCRYLKQNKKNKMLQMVLNGGSNIDLPLNLLAMDEGILCEAISIQFGRNRWRERRIDDSLKLLAAREQSVEPLKVLIAPCHLPGLLVLRIVQPLNPECQDPWLWAATSSMNFKNGAQVLNRQWRRSWGRAGSWSFSRLTNVTFIFRTVIWGNTWLISRRISIHFG